MVVAGNTQVVFKVPEDAEGDGGVVTWEGFTNVLAFYVALVYKVKVS